MKDFGARLARYLLKHPGYLLAWVIVVLELILVVIGPSIAPYPPEQSLPDASRLPPSPAHWFGTDTTALDVFSRVLAAPRVDLAIALVGNMMALAIGIPAGLAAGYYQGVVGGIVLRTADLIQAFPIFVMAMLLVAISGQNIVNVTFAIAFVQGPVYLRLIRGEVLGVRTRRFIEAARCLGISNRDLIVRHVLPNSLGPAIVQFSVNVGFAILLTAGLSFIGAGVRVPTPEWGSMVSIGAPAMVSGLWWMSFFPGLAIGITVLSFAMLSDSLSHIFYSTDSATA